MVENEQRKQGHGGGHSRKRRYRDDEGGGDRYRHQRRRYEEPIAAIVRRQLLNVAEPTSRRPEDDIPKIASMIAENYSDESMKVAFEELVLQMILEQPLKIPFIAAVILVLNTLKPEAPAPIISNIGEQAALYIGQGHWRNAKLMLRFLGCLQGLFEGDGIFPVLEELFSRAVDLQTGSSEDSLGLELVSIILYTIPYVMASSATGFESQASALLEKTDIIASTPHTLEAIVDPFPKKQGEDEGGRLSSLGLLQKQLQDEAAQSWKLACIPRPWKEPLAQKEPKENGDGEEKKENEETPKTPTKHAFPTIAVPNPVKTGPRAIFPEIYFSVYTHQDIETVPPTSDIASSLVRDALVDTINVLDFNRNATAKFLIDVDCYFAPDTFVKRAVPVDQLRDSPSPQKSTWKPEDVAVDAAFSQLLRLPFPEHKLVYYHSVLTESCKIAPAAVAPSLGRAIRFVYRNIDKLDLSLAYRFLDWFSHHLSNFGFTWKWTEWVADLELPDVHPKKAFIIGAIDKEIRLSFAQRIKGTLPEPYHELITEGKEKDTPDFKFSQETTPYSKEGQELMKLIRQKSSDEEIEAVITSIEEQAKTHGLTDPLIASTDVYMTSICYVGSKSLSHFLSCIERCKERLLAIGPKSDAARRQIINSVMEYWVDQPGIGINIIDKLLNYTILTPLSVLEWALVDNLAAGSTLAKPHIFEMISATMRKVTNRMRQIVAARTQPTLYEPQLSILDETLKKEKADMLSMFQLIEDTLVPVAGGYSDAMMERTEDDSLQPENVMIQQWGSRWLNVFRRKVAVERAFIDEAMTSAPALGTMAPPAPPLGIDEKTEESKTLEEPAMDVEEMHDTAEID
ncbi:Nuclear cap binding protein subunit 1 [Trichophyton interdigitale]|nr:Nuclear cap binding protein subunit 1 [Trichophyton interdigitale]KAG5217770.1 Nuclear cap binding protein subunit 1 [Trichophyton interdigitale]KAG8206241.1 Nuclear cap binding protein subunit 1 [Trichophyton interdigitale]